MTRVRFQTGATLVVSLIMLVVLTLLAVSAIRFGLVNLKISGNVQAETEAAAAAQTAIEEVVEDIATVPNIDAIPAQTITVQTGGASYDVNVTAPTCLVSVPILNQDLDPANANDVPCFEGADQDKLITATGALSTALSACNRQQWDVTASVTDAASGAQVTMVQGVAVRVPAGVACD